MSERKFSRSVANDIKDFFGFTLQKGSLYGTCYLPGHVIKQDYVFMGKKRRKLRPDGTFAGYEVYIYHKEHIPSWCNETDRELWSGDWFSCEKGSVAEKLLNSGVKVEYAPKQPKITGKRNLLAEVKRPQSKGFIYAMVRNGQ